MGFNHPYISVANLITSAALYECLHTSVVNRLSRCLTPTNNKYAPRKQVISLYISNTHLHISRVNITSFVFKMVKDACTSFTKNKLKVVLA